MRTKWSRTFYTEEFLKKALAIYYGSDEFVTQISERFEVNIETVITWIFRSDSERDKRISLRKI